MPDTQDYIVDWLLLLGEYLSGYITLCHRQESTLQLLNKTVMDDDSELLFALTYPFKLIFILLIYFHIKMRAKFYRVIAKKINGNAEK